MEDLKCIKLVTDEDLGLPVTPLNNPITRQGARGIVVRSDGKIALFYKSKMNEYKLPGGGIDKGEKPIDAFKREVLEEVGCEVENVQPLGYTEERKSKTNFNQISYIFMGEVSKDLGHLNLTEKEIGEGSTLLWTTPEEALKLIDGCVKNLKGSPVDETEGLYATKFIVYRDKNILQYYVNLLEKHMSF